MSSVQTTHTHNQLYFFSHCALITAPIAPMSHSMQCTSFYRDPYEHAAWQLYLRECALRAAREEVAFLEATGGATDEELARIRERVLSGTIEEAGAVRVKEEADVDAMSNNNTRLLNIMHTSKTNRLELDEGDDVIMVPPPALCRKTVSLKSVLMNALHPEEVNAFCRRVRPLLDRHGIATFKKHQAVHVLQSDTQRVLDLSAGLM